MRPQHFILVLAICAVLSIVGFGVWQITGPSTARGTATPFTRKASKSDKTLMRTAVAKPLVCPETQGAVLQSSSQTGHHRVILTWNASAPSRNSKGHELGYCLYRTETSKTSKIAERDPKCSQCEQINRRPIFGTACVDDLVRDGAKYYYVATAVNEDGYPSPLSNETFAPIPSDPTPVGSAVKGSYPRCRADNGSQ